MIRTAFLGYSLIFMVNAAAAATLDTIRQSGVIRIGYRTDASPLSYANPAGLPSGYTVDLCKMVVRGLKSRLQMQKLKIMYVPVTAKNRFDMIQQRKVDLLCGVTTVTLSRREKVDFSVLIYFTGASVLVRAGGAASFKQLAGKKIGVVAGTTTERSLRATIKADKINATIITVKGHPDGLKALESGKINAYFSDRVILLGLIASSANPEKLRIAKRVLGPEPYALAMRHGDSKFRHAVDWTLSRIYRSPTIVRIHRKNFWGRNPSKGLQTLYLMNALPE